MKAAVVAIGTEVTEGRIANTNAAEISKRLMRLGVETALHIAAPDDRVLMRRAFEAAAAAAEVVIVTGGLGPTLDDVTRDVAAEIAGVPLEMDAATVERLEAIFAAIGRRFSENNRRQALFPGGAEILQNDRGTAPGFRMTLLGAEFFFLPGVPHESEAMLEASVLPRLAGGGTVRVRRLNCFGLPESHVDAALAPLFPDAGPGKPLELAFNVSQGVVQIYLTSRGAGGEARLAAAAAAVREALGAHIFSEGKEELEETLVALLRARGLTLALAESCTGGRAASLVTRVPGSSDVFAGAIVAYANRVKVRQLGVPEDLIAAHGAVSAEVAQAMARGARAALEASIAAAITGIAGPGGGSAEKPVGLVYIAFAGDAIETVRELRLGGDRQWIQRLSAMAALDMVRRAVLRL